MDDRRHPDPDDTEERAEADKAKAVRPRREGRGGGTPPLPVERAVNAPDERR